MCRHSVSDLTEEDSAENENRNIEVFLQLNHINISGKCGIMEVSTPWAGLEEASSTDSGHLHLHQ